MLNVVLEQIWKRFTCIQVQLIKRYNWNLKVMINQEKKVNGVELTKLNADLKPLGYGRTYNYFPGKLKVSK